MQYVVIPFKTLFSLLEHKKDLANVGTALTWKLDD